MSLKKQREKKGYTQQELAALAGTKLVTIQMYEYGRRNINGAKLDMLCKLALALDCKIYDILDDEALKIKLKKTV